MNSSEQSLEIGVVSLFPEMFAAVTDFGVTGRAVREGKLTLESWNPRDYASDKHRTVDDRPYGGGPGMVMTVEPLRQAIQAAKQQIQPAKTIYLSPQGKVLTQAALTEMVKQERLVLVAGRYEGVDERLIDLEIDEEWSIGDYVLSGGELPAMVMIDAMARMIPGVLGHELSAEEDSFVAGLLDCPHYTRPEIYQPGNGSEKDARKAKEREQQSLAVPDVLMSGDHERIRRWRLQQSLGRTWQRRPELLTELVLDEEQQALLDEFKATHPVVKKTS